MKIPIHLIFIIVSLLSLSCEKDEECQVKVLEVKQLDSYYADCIDPRYSLKIDLSDNHTIIRSQQEFESKVSGSCNPVIDFSSYDLVIGKKRLTSGNDFINYRLVKDCSNKAKLTVTFHQNVTLEAPDLTYHALIPKLGDEETVNVEVVVN
jgi:hypothetical protein